MDLSDPSVCISALFSDNCEISRSLLYHPMGYKSSWDIGKDPNSLRKSAANYIKQSSLFQYFKVKSKEILLGLPALSWDSGSLTMDGVTDEKSSLPAPKR